MVFINDELKAIYIHNPKCGGVYIRNILCEFYGFKSITENLHNNYSIFFDNDNDIHLDEDTDKHTIRKLGKIRYFLSHQDVNKEVFKNYFTFTFVRNPYERLYSAYSYLYRNLSGNNLLKIRNTSENKDFFTDFNIFVENYKNVNNISYFHSFITQYDQLVDFSNNININYIGKMENLNNEFINILFYIGVKEIKHVNYIFNNIKLNSTEDFSKINNIKDIYNQETFNFVNEFFKKDFEIFGYKKYNNFDKFKKKYIKLEKQPKNPYHYTLTNLYTEVNLIKLNMKIQENIYIEQKKINQHLFHIIETNIPIQNQNLVNFNNCKNDFNNLSNIKESFIQTNLIKIENVIENLFTMNKSFKKLKYICKICNIFVGFNILSITSHKYTCKSLP
uniref:Sulfotransferase domain-containing protein n=1 Tax=viral metagenome TaxID=1070528 RepID=A0A6C0ID05_9ZZZZ